MADLAPSAGGGFKKKRRPQGSLAAEAARASSASASPAPEGFGAAAGGGDGVTGEDDDDAETREAVAAQIEEMIMLRKLKRSVGGIDLERLNAGDKTKKRKTESGSSTPAEVMNSQGMLEGTQGGIKGKDRMRDDDDGMFGGGEEKIVKTNNFTGQTNTVDVDKHMMAYIEEELRKRKKAEGSSEVFDTEEELKSLDPRDALYTVAEKYKAERKPTEEGNVALSTAMLTAIPEVDLGIDRRLKNIEDTEKAKRTLYEAQQRAKNNPDGSEQFAADRFFRHRGRQETDADALARAKREAQGMAEPAKTRPAGSQRKEMATDDQVMDRFKKRQAQQYKR